MNPSPSQAIYVGNDMYRDIFEALHTELGYSDYLDALQRYRIEDMCDLVNYDLTALLGAARVDHTQ